MLEKIIQQCWATLIYIYFYLHDMHDKNMETIKQAHATKRNKYQHVFSFDSPGASTVSLGSTPHVVAVANEDL